MPLGLRLLDTSDSVPSLPLMRIDAGEVQFALVPFGQAVRRIGEIDVAVGVQGQVVGAIELLAHVVVGEDGFLAVFFDARDAAVAVLAQVQPALGIDEQAVGAGFVAGFAAARLVAGVAGGFEKLGGALARFPLDDDVVGNVGEQQALARVCTRPPLRSR